MNQFCGLDTWLVRNINSLQYKQPTEIQSLTIPHILGGNGHLIGISKTGSGKTAAFCLPLLNELARDPTSVFAIILEPTRELALQAVEKLRVFTVGFNLRISMIIGGDDYIKQLLDLDKSPHIIVSTPGRLADLITNGKIKLLDNLKYLVLDEFDQLLNDTMEPKISEICKGLPTKEYTTLMFSATHDQNILPLSNIIKSLHLEVSTDTDSVFKYIYSFENSDLGLSAVNDNEVEERLIEKTVSQLNQHYLTMPIHLKELYLTQLLKTECKNKSVMIFVQTCTNCQFLYELLSLFDLKVSAIHSKMSQKYRFSDLQKFKSNNSKILVATDLACRGLDIPQVDYVINYDIPRNATDYIHRVGRTARAGRKGNSISFVTPSDVELILSIESYINKKLIELEFNEEDALKLLTTVSQAKKMVKVKLNDNTRLNNVDKKKKKFASK